MDDSIEMVAIELRQDLRTLHGQQIYYKELIEEKDKSINELSETVSELKSKLTSISSQNQGLKAQVHVRSEATQRLEVENSAMRDDLAKLVIQVEATNAEKNRLLLRCQFLEEDRLTWKTKCEEIQKSEAENSVYKAQGHALHVQLRSTVGQIISQHQLLEKDFTKTEKSVKEALSFAKIVQKDSAQQTAQTLQMRRALEDYEKNIVSLTAKLMEVTKERDDLLLVKNGSGDENKNGMYVEEWTKFQQEMNKRVEGFIDENQKLIEELKWFRDAKKQESTSAPSLTNNSIVTDSSNNEILQSM